MNDFPASRLPAEMFISACLKKPLLAILNRAG